MSERLQTEVIIAKGDNAPEAGITRWGAPSLYACPECHGVLLQLKEGSNVRFRCHTGHAYSLDALLAELTDRTEESLWKAIRSLEETVLLLRGMAAQLTEHGHDRAAAALEQQARQTQHRADLVRQAVMRHAERDHTAGTADEADTASHGEARRED